MSEPEPDSAPEAERSEVVVRRAPRFGAFLVVGALLGTLGTLVATSLFEPDPAVGFLGSFGYFLIYGIPAGVLLGAVVALVADAVSRRRARTATAERSDIRFSGEVVADAAAVADEAAGDDTSPTNS